MGVLGIDNENIDVIDFLHEGLTIYVGGERRYGFGKMELVYKLEIREEELESWGLDLEEGLYPTKVRIMWSIATMHCYLERLNM